MYLLGARAPSPAQRAQHAQIFLTADLNNNCSHFALIAGEGARAPSEMKPLANRKYVKHKRKPKLAMSTPVDQKAFKYVKYLWQDEVANQLSGLDRLVYRSNKLGEDLTLTNTGGGNTSAKLTEKDTLTGEEVEVLWVKGSGGDLRTSKRDGFASLYLDKVRAMKSLYLSDPDRGPKTQIEDALYPMYNHCVFNLNPRACSIDTPLHTLVPYTHVDHLHPNAVIAISASVNQENLCRQIYGG